MFDYDIRLTGFFRNKRATSRTRKKAEYARQSEYFHEMPIFMVTGIVNIGDHLLPALPIKILYAHRVIVGIWPLVEKERRPNGEIIYKNVDDFLKERIPPKWEKEFWKRLDGSWMLRHKGMEINPYMTKYSRVYFEKSLVPQIDSNFRREHKTLPIVNLDEVDLGKTESRPETIQ